MSRQLTQRATPPRIVLMEDYLDQARAMPCVQELAQHADLTIYTDKANSRDELLRRLAGARAVITIRDRVVFDAGIFERVRGLELLSVCGPRLQPHVDLEAAKRAGVHVVCAPPVYKSSIPHHTTCELTWLLILGLARNVEHNQAVLRHGGWQTIAGMGLAGKTLGVVGSTGKVGSLVVHAAKAFGMRVIAWSPRFTAERAHEQGIEAVSFDELLRTCDVLTLHANATAESQSMMGAQEFAKMKPTSLFVNTARAALVDEQALRWALDSGQIAAAGLDVYWEEPLPPDHWLRQHPKVLLQPHLGAFTPEGYEWIVAPGVEAVLRWLKIE
jgi:phosphoglycerate dehydrogenase-like enzyme